ncbi:MAG: hypothetical protein UU76_C0016G0002 [Parcubacteria group bacterium GW2011_GWC1_41_7]|nr:MAG: hypothetical protein UU76_C0016G0002 [Parcubacteria group bacterium GW2011_GWC1_41_7]
MNRSTVYFFMGIVVALGLGALAFDLPLQSPPSGGGALYIQDNTLRSQKPLQIFGKLTVGSSTYRTGIELYDSSDGSMHCLRILNDQVTASAGVCP